MAGDSAVTKRLGPLSVYEQGYLAEMRRLGYARNTINGRRALMRRLSRWLEGQGLEAAGLTTEVAESFLLALRDSDSRWQPTLSTLLPLLGYLRESGAAPAVMASVATSPTELLLVRYRDYLADERGLAAPVDVLHLLVVSVWLGGLVVLAAVLFRRDPATVALEAAVRRFSGVAASCVAVIVVTGVALAIPEVGDVNALGSTTYGNLLITKVALLASMLLVAAGSRAAVRRLNRVDSEQQLRVQEPELVLSGGGARRGTRPAVQSRPSRAAVKVHEDDVRSIGRSVVAELVLGAAILAVTATLVATPPAKVAYRPTMQRELTAGPVTIDLSAVPTTGTRTLTVRADTWTATGQSLDVPELRLRASLPSRSIAPLDIALQPNGTGHFLASAVRLPLAGAWHLEVYVRTSEVDSYTTKTRLDVR
jgi:copper transport protein